MLTQSSTSYQVYGSKPLSLPPSLPPSLPRLASLEAGQRDASEFIKWQEEMKQVWLSAKKNVG